MKKVLLIALTIFSVNMYSQCWVDVASGYNHSLGVKSDGSLWAWGSNYFGELGQGYSSYANVTSPIRVGTATNWSKVSVGGRHSVAIKTDGSLWAWGGNQYGQLGDGTNVNKYSPVQIGSSYNWSVIECGLEFTAALKTSGDFNSWGRNNSGQLGIGSTVDTNAPRSFDGPHFDRLSVGNNHCAGIQYLSGGAWVYTWGNNAYGQLGRGIGANVLGISQISLDPYAGVVCGDGHTLFLKPNGTVIARGKNTTGQLGYNSISNFIGPINYTSSGELIPGTGFTMSQGVSSGNGFTAIFKGTKLWTWGNNAQGQLGKGTTTNVNYPTGMDGFSSWRKVSAKGNSVLAIKNDGSLWAWGDNSVGQLGDGTTTNRLQPTNIKIAPTFASIDPATIGTSLTALPTTSLNGITGTWSPALNNTVTTTYTFTPTESNCVKNATITIYVNDPINPNGDELKYVASKDNSASVLSNFQVFPNPVNDILNIETTLDLQSVEIYSIQGQKVLFSQQKQVNVSDLSAGIYFVRIQDEKNNIATKRIIIE
ncbi:MAG: T9SS type A sorting domain-containing protein [Bacteroidota bacterium]